jgi:hypothetical protein
MFWAFFLNLFFNYYLRIHLNTKTYKNKQLFGEGYTYTHYFMAMFHKWIFV